MIRLLIKELERLGADDIVMSLHTFTETQIKFVNSVIATTKMWEDTSYRLFFAYKKRLISTTLQHLTKSNLKATASSLVSFAKALQPKEDYFGIAEGSFNYKTIRDTYDGSILDLDSQAPDIVKSAIVAAKPTRLGGVFEYGTGHTHLLTSNGVDAETRGSSYYLSMRALAAKDASAHEVRAGCMLKHLDAEKAAKDASRTALLARDPKGIKLGKYDVVFEPLAFANLLDHVGNAASMFSVEAGLSFLAGKHGKKVASDKVTIIDDPLIPNGVQSTPFDDEGVPTRRTEIIKEGVLKNYLFNTSLARKHGKRTTGNAGLVCPRPWNVVMKKGKYNKGELLKKTGKGLLITNLWYTRFQNYLTGQFSTVPRDAIFIIEDGELKGAVKGIRVSDDLPRMLCSVVDSSNESRQIMCWETESPVISPAVSVKDVNITGSK
ncbi:MAG: TldD/PmbA family protein [Nanoarchaeota archaeon]|nr:TldD/PmbA family protein [Nanoarchaeota archaeon]